MQENPEPVSGHGSIRAPRDRELLGRVMHRRVLVAVHHALGTGLGTRDGSAGDAKKGSRSSQSWGRDGARGGMELGEGWSSAPKKGSSTPRALLCFSSWCGGAARREASGSQGAWHWEKLKLINLGCPVPFSLKMPVLCYAQSTPATHAARCFCPRTGARLGVEPRGWK